MKEIEISSLDTRYESHRLKNNLQEKYLLSSIAENGIRDPLQGINENGRYLLLDGFKRYRCSKKLGISILPWNSLGDDEALGIISLIRTSNANSLTILEQASLIDELKSTYKMSNAEIAARLERSKSWVGMRHGIINEMSSIVKQKILGGKFPMYSYMYTLRAVMRMTGTKKCDIERFVTAVSGKGLSTRDIEILAHGYFKGSDSFRNQINTGNVGWCLDRMRSQSINDCTEIEQRCLKDFAIIQKYINKIIAQGDDKRLKSSVFLVQADLFCGALLKSIVPFSKALNKFYDRSRKAQNNFSASS